MKTEYLAQLPRLAALELKPERADTYGIARQQPVFLLELQTRKGYAVPWVYGFAGAPGHFRPSDFTRYLGYQAETYAS